MMNNLPFLVVGIPLFTALLMGALNYWYPKIVRPLGIIGISFATYYSIKLFNYVNNNGVVEYFLEIGQPQ